MNIEFDLNRIIVYFVYGLIYCFFIGLLNKKIESLRTRSEKWNYYIVQLDIERKTVHVLCWFCILIIQDVMPLSNSATSMGCYYGFVSFLLAILNIIRLCVPSVKQWVSLNWKGFQRNEDTERWPAVFSLQAALSLANLATGMRTIVVLGVTSCTTGDAFACFMGRLFPNSREIRNGKSIAGFLGAGILTAIHCLCYCVSMGYIQNDLWTWLNVLFWGFWIGGISDFLPSKEIGLDDNFTTVTLGTAFWYSFTTISPHFFTQLA